MKSGLFLRLGALAITLSLAVAECPNACSGHGTCGSYDMCSCYNGYFGNDCVDRICPFGLAHVDSPKGDLDMDNDIEYKTVISGSQMYPDGTSELFPIMQKADGTVLIQTAHDYSECSNKGMCDRVTGSCICFTGYEGSSCQRASCPNLCSGHGVCKTVRELATGDYDNIYELWDADVGMGCDCDAGYDGSDCSGRICPYGIDPLFIDDENTARVSVWNLYFEESTDITATEGTWRMKFYDVFGESWVTDPLSMNAACTTVEDTLVALPNDVISDATVLCSDSVTTTSLTYELTFSGNPGYLKVPELIYMDETGRYTLKDSAASAYGGITEATVFDKGVIGEFYDYFGKKCDVIVDVADSSLAPAVYGTVQDVTINSGSTGTLRTLKECLGDSNGVAGDNVGVENWDFGSELIVRGVAGATDLSYPDQYPHVVKLVDSAASSEYDGGEYAIMHWDVEGSAFVLSTAVDNSASYQVFATDGVLERIWYDTDMNGEFSMADDELGLSHWEQYSNVVYTSRDFSCENAGVRSNSGVFYSNSSYIHNNCVEKGDLLVFPASTTGNSTSKNVTGDMSTLNLDEYRTRALNTPNSAGFYIVMKISVEDYTATTNSTEDRYQIVLDRPIFWDGSRTSSTILDMDLTIKNSGPRNHGIRPFFKFTPDSEMSYSDNVVSECSNRGLCDDLTGLCTCFAGYTNENCDTQSALAV